MIKTGLLGVLFVCTASLFLAVVSSWPSFFGNAEVAPASIRIQTAALASASIFAGVLAKLLYDDLAAPSPVTNGSESVVRHIGRSLEPSRIVRSLILAPVVLALIYGELVSLSNLLVAIVSFQNGFFFQSITKRTT